MRNRFRTSMKTHAHVLLVLYAPLYLIAFFLLERHVVTDYWVSYTPFDDKIPFLEGFVVFYGLWYPLLVGTGLYLLLRDVPAFRRYMYFIIIGFSLSLAICLVFPNGQDLRPVTFARDNVFTRIVQALYRSDTNTNVLPSMHVVGCVAAVLAAFDTAPAHKAWIRAGVVAAGVLICASTVFIKQHSILDFYAGAAVSVPIWFVVYGKRRLSIRFRRPGSH